MSRRLLLRAAARGSNGWHHASTLTVEAGWGGEAALNELPPLHVLHITNGKSRPRGKVKLNLCRSLCDVPTITFNVIWLVLGRIGVSLRSSPGNQGAPDELSVCRRPYQAAATQPQIELINCVCLGFFMRHDL